MISLALIAAISLSQAPNLSSKKLENPLVTKQKEKEDLVNKLKRDIFKVDRAIGETNKLIAKSRNAPYLPDLQFRLAELYVEKSRYTYYYQAETRSDNAKGAIVSPETKLYKEKAVQIYNRILRENVDFHDGDKVTFYLAHEQREMGEFDTMLKTLGDLIRKYPSSPLRLDAEQILGDYFFDKADLKAAEEHYKNILDAPPSPVHDLARYKMGWIRVNQNNYADAVTFFEAAAASAPMPGIDVAKSLNVKREALLDLVYSYTESRPAKGALQYFEKLSESRTTYALALDKLGNRYFIKQQYEFAIPALRKLMEVQPDPELEVERAEKIYDSIKAAKNKVLPKPQDVEVLVRAAVQTKQDPAKDEVSRKKTLAELEEMARDLSTTIHTAAQKRDDKALFLEAADAYESYLGLFRPKQYATMMMQNRADALFAAKQYPQAARQFEELALYLDQRDEKPRGGDEKEAKDPNKLDVAKDPKPAAAPAKDAGKAKDPKLAAVAAVSKSDSTQTVSEVKNHEQALYGALLSYFSSLKPGDVERLNAFEVADARQALKLLGAEYVSRYAKSEHVLEIKFNIARAYYEDGDYPKAGELFRDFAVGHPEHKDARVAANLALDAFRQINDFKGLKETGEILLKSKLPPDFLAEVRKIMTESKTAQIFEGLIENSVEGGDLVEALLKMADENKGTENGENALYGAFTASRDKRDFKKQREVGQRLLQEYPKSKYVSDVLLTLGRQAAEAGRYADAAKYFEDIGARFSDSTGLDGWLASARLKVALGDYNGAVKALETAAESAGARKVEVLTELARTKMKMKEPEKARAVAEQVLKLDKTNPTAAAIITEVAASDPKVKPESLVPMLTAMTNNPQSQGEDAAKALWYLGDMMYRQFKAMPNDPIEGKVQAMQQMQGIFQQAAQMGSQEWAVASLWRIASSLKLLADAVESLPPPAGLSATEVAQYREAIKGQVDPLKEQADNAFGQCVSRADQLDVFTTPVVGCRNKTETATNPLGRMPPQMVQVNTEELQKSAENKQDAASFEQLALANLGGFHLKDAQVALNRAIEIEDNRASAHSALGYSFLLEGDAMTARAEYARALEADPTFEKARANLAALRCRFADRDGAKRELSLLKDPEAIKGADIDPEWKTCK
ncbi:MAG: tetratricopeptide repeat protein [Archangiaceae bacterium]|nr:tetratricopeptide repeat protein [Archangiaceae bacterium]